MPGSKVYRSVVHAGSDQSVCPNLQRHPATRLPGVSGLPYGWSPRGPQQSEILSSLLCLPSSYSSLSPPTVPPLLLSPPLSSLLLKLPLSPPFSSSSVFPPPTVPSLLLSPPLSSLLLQFPLSSSLLLCLPSS